MTAQVQRASLPPRLGASLVLTVSLVIAGAAAAQPNNNFGDLDSSRSVHVSYADLNLHTQAGARAIMARIDDAAVRACGGAPDLRMLERRALFNSCKTQTFNQAVRDLDAPLVTAMADLGAATVVIAGR